MKGMAMTIHSKISLDGKDYIILPLADYDALRAAAEEAEDEAAGVEAMAARDDAKARGELQRLCSPEVQDIYSKIWTELQK